MRRFALSLSLVSLLGSGLACQVFAQASSQGQLPVVDMPATAPPVPAASVPPAPIMPVTPMAATTIPPVAVVAPATSGIAGTPSTPAPAAPLAGAPIPAAATPTPAALLPEFKPTGPFRVSAGESNLSVFFTPNQVKAMRDALTTYESTHTDFAQGALFIDQQLEVEKIQEPQNYPVFYLSSIAYRAPNDWSIWVSGHKITSRQNTTTLKVTGITADAVSFLWEPTYGKALSTRYDKHLFANADAIKHKFTHPVTYQYYKEKGVVTFTLRPNQSFVAGYMSTFEGYVPSPTMLPVPVETAPGATEPAPQVATPTPPANPSTGTQLFVHPQP